MRLWLWPSRTDTLAIGPKYLCLTSPIESDAISDLKSFCVLKVLLCCLYSQILKIYPLLIPMLWCHSAFITAQLPCCHSLPTGSLSLFALSFIHSFIHSFI
jgi:hypothetical protein